MKRALAVSLVSLLILVSLGLAKGTPSSSKVEEQLIRATQPLSQIGTQVGTGFLLYLDKTPQGVAGYKVRVYVDKGTISGLEVLTLPGIGTEIAPDGKSALFAAVDFLGVVEPGARRVELAQVWVRSTVPNPDIKVTMELFYDDQGDQLKSVPVSVRPLSGGITGLQVERILATPNPAINSNAIRFQVEGQGVAALRVRVYDLSGQRIYDSGFAAGGKLAWHLMNDQGEALANGVYLYLVTVRGHNGELFRTEVRKLVILR